MIGIGTKGTSSDVGSVVANGWKATAQYQGLIELNPERIAADSAYGSAEMLGWLPVALTQASLDALIQIIDVKSTELHIADEDRAKIRDVFKRAFEAKAV